MVTTYQAMLSRRCPLGGPAIMRARTERELSRKVKDHLAIAHGPLAIVPCK